MLNPAPFTLPEAREALRAISDQHEKVYFALKRDNLGYTLGCFKADAIKVVTRWMRKGFSVIDGPLETLQVAKTAVAVDYAYERAQR